MQFKQNIKNIFYLKIIFLFCCYSSYTFAEISCHLHPAKVLNYSYQTTRIQGPYSNQEECNHENKRLYQLKGRCHCTFTTKTRPFNTESPESKPQEYNALP